MFLEEWSIQQMIYQLTHGLQIYTPANAHQQDVSEVHADIGLGRWILHSLQILVIPDARVISSPVNHS